jgi:hypothetical protein
MDGSACQRVRRDLKMPTIAKAKITETTRQAALKQPLKPSIIKDAEIAGFQLIVTTQRAFWAQSLQPRGLDPNGRRWTMVRHELGDAETMTVLEARAASLAAKAAIRQGRPPPRAIGLHGLLCGSTIDGPEDGWRSRRSIR